MSRIWSGTGQTGNFIVGRNVGQGGDVRVCVGDLFIDDDFVNHLNHLNTMALLAGIPTL